MNAHYIVHKILSQFDDFQYLFKFHAYGGNLENNFHLTFVIDDGLCLNLTLCCEINAYMNDIIVQ